MDSKKEELKQQEKEKKVASKAIAEQTVKVMRQNKAEDKSIFCLLKSAYGKYFSDNELNQFLKTK